MGSDNQQIIVDFLQAVKANDMDGIMEFFAPDCFYHNVPLEPVVGTVAIRQVLEGFNSLASEVEWTAHNMAETATGHVMTERTDAFLIGGKWVKLPVMGIFELKEGKITAWRDYFDANQMMRLMTAEESSGEQ
jgi:limonene-1,2-epoxide hydrolase